MPACWKDLLKPDYKGMVGYLDPSSAAVGYVGAVAVNNALGGSDKDFSPAITYFKDLHKNQPIVPKQTSYARVVSGEIPILFDYDFNAYRAKYTEKGNFEFVIPCEGSVVFPYVVSLVKGAPDKAKAEKVLDYMLSDKGQAIWTQCLFAPGAADPAAGRRQVQVPARQRLRPRQERRLGEDGSGAKRIHRPLPRRSAMRHHGAPDRPEHRSSCR